MLGKGLPPPWFVRHFGSASVTTMRASLLLCLLGAAVAVPQLSCPAGKFHDGAACADCPVGRYKLSQTVHGCAKCAPGNVSALMAVASADARTTKGAARVQGLC